MWPIKYKQNRQLFYKVAKYFPLSQATGMCRYGSLINIHPSEADQIEDTFGEKSFCLRFSIEIYHPNIQPL